MGLISDSQKRFFVEQGYLVMPDLLTNEEVNYYAHVYNSFLNNSIDSSGFRSDLSGSEEGIVEKITQIMVPSRIYPDLLDKPLHEKSLHIARELLGDDLGLDFDMLINKAPNTSTKTPWHQDAAYWLDMPDTRAVSCWVAIDHAYKENGCMWYTPKSHLGKVLPHTQTGNKGALTCDGREEDSVCIELHPGSCVFHHGKTLHYSRGNSTETSRRAFITNFRPKAMIALERKKGIDHTGDREVKS